MRPLATEEKNALPALDMVIQDSRRNRLRRLARLLREGFLQVLGIPDYRAYLSHMATHHPDQAPLSRQQFVKQAIDRKYGRSGPRCC